MWRDKRNNIRLDTKYICLKSKYYCIRISRVEWKEFALSWTKLHTFLYCNLLKTANILIYTLQFWKENLVLQLKKAEGRIFFCCGAVNSIVSQMNRIPWDCERICHLLSPENVPKFNNLKVPAFILRDFIKFTIFMKILW